MPASLGFERMLMFVTGVSNIRDVIPSPHSRFGGILTARRAHAFTGTRAPPDLADA